MIDLKSKLVLKILANECGNGNYKIVELSDVILALPRRYRMDSEAVKHILNYLERQDIISIKYDDDNVFCLAVLPYGFELLETEKPINYKTKPAREKKWNFWMVASNFVSALVGTILGIVICYFLLKLF